MDLFEEEEIFDETRKLIFYLLCYVPVLKFLTYYAQYYIHVKDLCFKFGFFIRVYSLSNVVTFY